MFIPEVPGFLSGSLPSSISELRPVPETWDDFYRAEPENRKKHIAAVGFLFLPPESPGKDALIVLTKRSQTVRTHKGQIGFAGGVCDPGDSGPKATVAREIEEEIAINRDHLYFIGALPTTYAINSMPVVPLVLCANIAPSSLIASPDEVAKIILTPWPKFRTPNESIFNYLGLFRKTYIFRAQGHIVWGLTARILAKAELQ